MFRSVDQPRVAVIGLSLALYDRAIPGFMGRLKEQLARFVAPLAPKVQIAATTLCFESQHVEAAVARAEEDQVDALLIIPLSYTASLMTAPALARTTLPIVIWNTQDADTIESDYSFDDLLMNHVTQGTQDLTNVLLRSGRLFGMESGHHQDRHSVERLTEWLVAARAARYAQSLRVGLLGRPFQDMGDFAVDESIMAADWGPRVIRLDIPELVRLYESAPPNVVSGLMDANRLAYEIDSAVDDDMHRMSARLGWALRRMIDGARLDAFTMNFLEIIADGRCPTLPFLGVNQAIGEGLGYAGEGDVLTAAHMAQMRQLCGAANFTEIFTIDYRRNRLLMMHMQECNPALARLDRKIRLVRKDFWAPGVQPYVGMHFTLEPAPVTLVAVSADGQGGFYYVVHETTIVNAPPLKRLDVPHWLVEPAMPVTDFLNDYSLSGGPHHLVAVPGLMSSRIEKLAELQGFDLRMV